MKVWSVQTNDNTCFLNTITISSVQHNPTELFHNVGNILEANEDTLRPIVVEANNALLAFHIDTVPVNSCV